MANGDLIGRLCLLVLVSGRIADWKSSCLPKLGANVSFPAGGGDVGVAARAARVKGNQSLVNGAAGVRAVSRYPST